MPCDQRSGGHYVLSMIRLFALGTLAAGFSLAAEPSLETITFPSTMKWCVATSHQQIEGNNSNDHTDLELQPGKVLSEQRAGSALNHWADPSRLIALQNDFGNNVYRMSIDWARIEPQPGAIDESAVQRYRSEILENIRNGREVQITLYHFTFPRWVAARGGWTWNGLPEAFANFARLVKTRVAPEVRDYYTINEPMVSVFGGYYSGFLPPGRISTRLDAIREPLRGAFRTHAAAYRALHDAAIATGTPVRVSVAHHVRIFKAAQFFDVGDRIGAKSANAAWNWAFLEALQTGRADFNVPTQLRLKEEFPGLKGTLDFIGLNYYSGDRVDVNLFKGVSRTRGYNKKGPRSDMGWDIYPKGLYELLVATSRRFKSADGKPLPIMVTENGVADSSDRLRVPFVRDHLYWLNRAIEKGVPVEGYCLWSLVDSYEWHEGWKARFGAYGYDLNTGEYYKRPSATALSEIVKTNRLTYDKNELGKYPSTEAQLPPENPPAWPAGVATYSNGTCRAGFWHGTNSRGEPLVRLLVKDTGYMSSSEEGWVTMRLSDGVVLDGPRACAQLTPGQRAIVTDAPNGDRTIQVSCGDVFDHAALKLKLTVSGSNWAAPNAIKELSYDQTVRGNDPLRNFTHYEPDENAQRQSVAAIRCSNLRPE